MTVTKASDDPLVVTYAFNPKAVWDDGQPVGCDDVYLAWIANNGVAKGTDSSGAAAALFQTASTAGWDQVGSVACSADGRTATFTYTKPFSDWTSLVRGLVPAHVVATHAGLAASADIRTAYEAHDAAPSAASPPSGTPASRPTTGSTRPSTCPPGRTASIRPRPARASRWSATTGTGARARRSTASSSG